MTTTEFLPRENYEAHNIRSSVASLKGLGHAILSNFSIDQAVRELTEITK